MPTESSQAPPSIELLRVIAAQQGVYPEDDDLQAVLGFLRAILPGLEEIERRLPAEAAP